MYENVDWIYLGKYLRNVKKKKQYVENTVGCFPDSSTTDYLTLSPIGILGN